MSRKLNINDLKVCFFDFRKFSLKKYPRASVFTIVLSENGPLSYRALQDCCKTRVPFVSLIRFLTRWTCFSFLSLHHIDVFYNGPVELYVKASSQCFSPSFHVQIMLK